MKRQLSAPSYIPPPSPEVLLRSTVWLQDMDEEIIDYIASLAEEKIFDSGETIVRQGDKTDGMYLIITGLVKMIGVSIPLKEHDEARLGEMNIQTDYLCAGNIIGEMGMLTGSARNASVTCETTVQVYFLSMERMQKALQLYPSLTESIWRHCSIRIAVPLLMSHPSYNGWTKEKIRLFCEKSTMVHIPKSDHGQTVFEPSAQAAEVILIHGKIMYTSNRDTYEGPCILPSCDERLLVHHTDVSPRILEIQGVDLDPGPGSTRLQSIADEDIASIEIQPANNQKSTVSATEIKFRGKAATTRALEPLPHKYKGMQPQSVSLAPENNSSKLVEVSEK